MPEQQRTATNRLADVIQVVLFARQTGVLLVERGAGNAFEEGKIIFVDGQVVQASAQGRTGLAAFNWLNGWGSCWYMFVPTSTSAITPSMIPPPSTPTPTALGPSPVTGPIVRRDISAYSEKAKNTGRLSATPASDAPVRLQPVNQVLPYLERMAFSRLHRRVFLLIDGQRNLAELARLTGLRIDEIRKVVDDLGRAGLIQQ